MQLIISPLLLCLLPIEYRMDGLIPWKYRHVACEQISGCWELNLGNLQEQKVLLTIRTSLQSLTSTTFSCHSSLLIVPKTASQKHLHCIENNNNLESILKDVCTSYASIFHYIFLYKRSSRFGICKGSQSMHAEGQLNLHSANQSM